MNSIVLLGLYWGPEDSSAGVPSAFIYVALGIIAIILYAVYLSFKRDRKLKEKVDVLNQMDVNPSDIRVETVYDVGKYSVRCLIAKDNSEFFRIVSDNFDKQQGYLRISNLEEFIYIENFEIVQPVFRYFAKLMLENGFKKILVDDLPTYVVTMDMVIDVLKKLGFIQGRMPDDSYCLILHLQQFSD